jgi:hypothetical protein
MSSRIHLPLNILQLEPASLVVYKFDPWGQPNRPKAPEAQGLQETKVETGEERDPLARQLRTFGGKEAQVSIGGVRRREIHCTLQTPCRCSPLRKGGRVAEKGINDDYAIHVLTGLQILC